MKSQVTYIQDGASFSVEGIKVRADYKCMHINGSYFGDIVQVEDGLFYFFPLRGVYGFWSSNIMREIADKLDALNAQVEGI